MPNDVPTAEYLELLEAERASLANELSELGFGTLPETGLSYDANFADSSQVNTERGEAESLASELRAAFVDVEEALAKIALGTYGICENCGQQIAPDRLAAKPSSKLCFACASQQR